MQQKNKPQLLRYGLLLICIFGSFLTYAQTSTITGKVVSTEGEELLGVSVSIKGTSTGTSTDFNGDYTITVPNAEAVLMFSSIGYTTLDVPVNGQTVINVTLQDDLALLDQVVVVGYGTRKKSDVTGAVSSVKSEELNAFPVLDAAQALQGRAAGVEVQTNNGGEPGAPINIRIRGNTSINASSSPLIVVDGFVGANFPQPADIASIEVLKDASATAIYGSRGSNGVVLVTTKRGKVGKISVEYNFNYSNQRTANELDLLNADQFTTYQQIINPAYVSNGSNTDWQDLIYQNGNIQQHQFSFSGGTEDINFYASANYFDQEGVVVNSDFERFTFLSNLDAQVNDKLKLGLNLFASRGTQNGVPTQSNGNLANGGGDDVVASSFRFAPDLGVFDTDGNFTVNSVGDDIDNPFAVATQSVNETKNDLYRANLSLNYEIIEGLTFRSSLGYESENETAGVFRPSSLTITAGGVGGVAAISSFKRSNLLSENFLTYKREIGKGDLTLLGGYSYQNLTNQNYAAGAQQFISDSFSYFNLGGGSVQLIPSSSRTVSEIQSQFGRVNYDYDDKYLITATIRRDGASNFAENEKHAVFPSGAIGWKISNEPFFANVNNISELKLRASYGATGNQGISAFQSLARFNSVYAVINGDAVNNVVPDQPANPNLKWETSYQTNVGLDVGLLNDRITLSADYYNIDTEDLIIADDSQAEYLGFLTTASLRNIGEVNNKGFEFNINSRNIVGENFTWSTDFNISTNRNEVSTLLNGEDIFLDASPGYFNIDETHVLREGESTGAFYGYEYRGVYQGGALPEGTAVFSGSVAGDPLYTDIPNEDGMIDGEITTADRKILGDPNPDFSFGFSNNFTYKNFDMNIFFQGAVGGDIMNLTALQLNSGDSNASTDILNAWTPSNTNTNIPSVALRTKRISSQFLEDGSYVRLKNISVGYTFPNTFVEKMGVSSLRLAISAQNLFTITNYSGLDPEASYFGAGSVSNRDSNTTRGFDFGNYPTLRSFNFSANIKF
ncbi:SusC/RagA family TonB-linked outer membrane protein [Nonlabens sp. Asnod3-A02]|uniref:SusC/RagA family TonB-linked outer membrane protein n=1 Tax=Nonlabens sp. Asnod3-A02 TaxID=3160579 RepID=UPI00386D3DC3